MVRASRNASNLRMDLAQLRGQAPAAGRLMARAPGGAPVAVEAPEVPAAALLDKHGWARSFGAFLAAIADPRDAKAARAEIARIRNATMGERVPSDGGFLVPWGLQQKILALMTTAVVRPRATYIPVAGLRESVPFLENSSQSTAGQALAGLTFSIVQQGSAFTATAPEFGRTTLEVSKVGAYLTGVPNELLEDSPAFTEVFLPTIIARGLAFYEDSLFITDGNGVGQPESLLNSPAALAVSRTGTAPVHADIIAMAKALTVASWPTACWLLSDSAFAALLELYLAVGTAPSGADVTPPEWLKFDAHAGHWTLLGVPAFPTDMQPAAGSPGDVMLADLGLYLVGDKGEMSVEVSSKGSGFVSGTSNIRIRHRVDGRLWPQSAYTTRTGQTVSPLVVLT